MKVYNSDHSELMDVHILSKEGNNLVIQGSIMEAMPVRCVLTPTEVRAAFKLMNWKLILFLITLPFRS